MKASKTILVGVLTIGSIGFTATSALACHGSGYGYSSYYYPQYVPRAYITEVAPAVVAPRFAPAPSGFAMPLQGFAGGMPQGQQGLPPGMQGMPNGFAGGMP